MLNIKKLNQNAYEFSVVEPLTENISFASNPKMLLERNIRWGKEFKKKWDNITEDLNSDFFKTEETEPQIDLKTGESSKIFGEDVDIFDDDTKMKLFRFPMPKPIKDENTFRLKIDELFKLMWNDIKTDPTCLLTECVSEFCCMNRLKKPHNRQYIDEMVDYSGKDMVVSIGPGGLLQDTILFQNAKEKTKKWIILDTWRDLLVCLFGPNHEKEWKELTTKTIDFQNFPTHQQNIDHHTFKRVLWTFTMMANYLQCFSLLKDKVETFIICDNIKGYELLPYHHNDERKRVMITAIDIMDDFGIFALETFFNVCSFTKHASCFHVSDGYFHIFKTKNISPIHFNFHSDGDEKQLESFFKDPNIELILRYEGGSINTTPDLLMTWNFLKLKNRLSGGKIFRNFLIGSVAAISSIVYYFWFRK